MIVSTDWKSQETPSFGRSNPSVAILLCTKNGAAFLAEQLQSFEDQTHKNWFLIASDDGSTDETVDILRRSALARRRSIVIKEGPRRRARENFLSLATDPAIDADYFAYSDQDDLWHPDKLERALALLAGIPDGTAALYCGRTEIVDIEGAPLGLSPLFSRPPVFRNALVQNIGGGNTMVFNRAAKKLLETAGKVAVVEHDWWTYQLVSAAGGTVRYDPQPVLKYRQHAKNLIGSNAGWPARFLRIRLMLGNRFGEWNALNIGTLQSLRAGLILPENLRLIDLFASAVRASPAAPLFPVAIGRLPADQPRQSWAAGGNAPQESLTLIATGCAPKQRVETRPGYRSLGLHWTLACGGSCPCARRRVGRRRF